MLNIEHKLNKIDKYFITPDFTENNANEYFEILEKILISGIKLVQFRSKNLKINDYACVSKKIYNLCKKYKAIFIINNYINLNLNKYCDGIQLTSDNIKKEDLSNIDKKYILIGSCHNFEEVKICNTKQLDLILISPIRNTNGKIGIGWKKFNKLVVASTIPVFALGGLIYDQDIENVKKNGGVGIAASKYFYNLFNTR